MPIPSVLAYAITFAVYLKYPIIFLATTFGGPILMLASGFLLHEGAFDLVPIFLALALGELTWDAVWYGIGYFYADRLIAGYGHYFNFTTEVFGEVKALFVRYDAVILFISKLIMGLGIGIAVLVTGGATKVSFWKYMLFNALGEVLWVTAMLYIGFFYAGLYGSVANSLKLIFIIGTVLAIFTLMYGSTKYLRKKALGEK